MSYKVFGHINPDTDTVASAIVYAWFLTNHRGTEATAYVLGSLPKEPAFVLKRFGFDTPALLDSVSTDDHVVLVDTNNPDELPAGINDATLHEIVDHHKLVGGLHTPEPLQITMRPVACTATVIWELMQKQAVQPTAEIAGLMLASIISDTLNFTSPTTTDEDRAVADELAALAGLTGDELAEEMFAAKSDISDLSAEQILTMDSKVFSLGDKKVRVSTLETTRPENVHAVLPQIKDAIAAMKTSEGLDLVFFFIVNILTTGSELLLVSDAEKAVAEKGYEKAASGELLDLPGVVSRKKQMIPAIEKGLA